MGKIVVVGSSNTDMVLRCAHLPKPGEKASGNQFAMAGGGKGANQAVGAARLGADVTFVARLGRDWMGDQAIAKYRAEGIDCSYIVRDAQASSGVALIMVDAAGENLIGVAPGANATLLPQHVERAEPVFRSANVLLLQLEIPLETIARAIGVADKWNVRVILNPAPARDLPNELLRDVMLTPNQTEAAYLAGMAVSTMSDVEQAAITILNRGVRAVVITLGERARSSQRRRSGRRFPVFGSMRWTQLPRVMPSMPEWRWRSRAGMHLTPPCGTPAPWVRYRLPSLARSPRYLPWRR